MANQLKSILEVKADFLFAISSYENLSEADAENVMSLANQDRASILALAADNTFVSLGLLLEGEEIDEKDVDAVREKNLFPIRFYRLIRTSENYK